MLREATGAEPREELHRLPPELAGELLDWPTRSFWRTDCSKTRWRRPRTPSETSLDARAIGWCAWRLAQTLDGASWRAHDGNIVSTAAGPVLVHLSRQPVMGRWSGISPTSPRAPSAPSPSHDDDTIAKLRAGVSFCVAAWCLATPDPTPAVAKAAEDLLESAQLKLAGPPTGPDASPRLSGVTRAS
jgi:hypothetical protein